MSSLWRREWLPTLVVLPREFHGQKSLMGQRVGHDSETNPFIFHFFFFFTLKKKGSSEIGSWIKQFHKPSVSDTSGSSDYSVLARGSLLELNSHPAFNFLWVMPSLLYFNNLSVSLKLCKSHNFRNKLKGTFCIRSDLSMIYCCYCSVTKSCPTLWDPMDCTRSDFPVLHYPLEFAHIHVHWVGDAI